MNDIIVHELNQIFSEALSPLKINIFFNSSKDMDFSCLFSSHDNYKRASSYSVYNILPLLRILIKKNDILSEDLLSNFYDNAPFELCYIHEWNDHSKKVFIFSLESLSHFDQVKLNSIIKNETQKLDQVLQKLFFSFNKSENFKC